MKIKSSVDLKILEKFGFEYEPATKGYYSVYFPKLLWFIPIPYSNKVRGLAIYEDDREIVIKRREGFIWLPTYGDTFAVKNLIKAGLVEE